MAIFQQVLTSLPYERIQDSVNHLDERKAEYSQAAGKIVVEIKGLLAKGVEAYTRSSGRILDFANSAESRLKSYIKLYDDVNATNIEEQKTLLVEVLDEGIKKMKLAQSELGESSTRYWKKNLDNFEGQRINLTKIMPCL